MNFSIRGYICEYSTLLVQIFRDMVMLDLSILHYISSIECVSSNCLFCTSEVCRESQEAEALFLRACGTCQEVECAGMSPRSFG